MRRILLALVMLCAPAWAGLTTITQTIKNPDGTNFTGTLEISLNESCTQPDGTFVFAETKRVAVGNGSFSVTLYPNTTCTPSGTSYFVRYTSRGNIVKAEFWVVGTTTPTTIDAVRSSIIPSPNLFVAPAQISQAGATVGQLLAWNGYNWGPSDLTGVSVTSVFGRTGEVTATTADYSFSQIAGTVGSSQLPAPGGDIGGTYASMLVQKLQTRAVASTAPTTGQVLMWSGTAWAPSSTFAGNAATATALAADPPPCSTNQWVIDMAANGGLSCTQPASTSLSDSSALVRGGANLTSASYFPYAASAGTLTQSVSFYRDSSTGTEKIRVHDATPTTGKSNLQVVLGAGQGSSAPFAVYPDLVSNALFTVAVDGTITTSWQKGQAFYNDPSA
ncbi:MAG TPA: hypothetical protein VNA25_07450, partial [Phycisphaerae bacterium]|nr:hypothetical protein [Phycisphaerae bacterium]